MNRSTTYLILIHFAMTTFFAGMYFGIFITAHQSSPEVVFENNSIIVFKFNKLTWLSEKLVDYKEQFQRIGG